MTTACHVEFRTPRWQHELAYLVSGWLLCISGLTRPLPGAENAALFLAARNGIQATELYQHVQVLADDTLEGREAGSPGGRAAAGYVVKRLEKLGLLPAGEGGSYFQPFDKQSRNILARLEPAGLPQDAEASGQVIMISAHIDHVGYGKFNNSFGPTGFIHNGADDNASGVAAVLELAEACTQAAPLFRRPLVFCFWDAEEQGLIGSKYWIKQPTFSRQSLGLVINLDMVGRLRETGLEVHGWRALPGLRTLLTQANAQERVALSFPWKIEDSSDHYSFLEAGMPAMMLHTGLHENYHRPSDDVERINREGMQQVTRLTFELLGHLATAETLPSFRQLAMKDQPEDERQAEKQANPARLGVSWDRNIKDRIVLSKIVADGPGAQAGLRVRDAILSLDGEPVSDGDVLQERILTAGENVQFQVQRNGEPQVLQVEVRLAGAPAVRGLQWRTDPVEPGVLIVTRVVSASAAGKAGLKAEDRIMSLEAAQQSASLLPSSQWPDLLAGAETLTLAVERRGTPLSLILPAKLGEEPPAPSAQ